MSNIKNLEAFMSAIVDWEFLNDCFPRNIRVTDIDGFVEINGNGLILECKKRDEIIPKGQNEAYKNMCLSSKITIIIFWADLDNHNVLRIYNIKTYSKRDGKLLIKEHEPTIEKLKFLVKFWVELVNN